MFGFWGPSAVNKKRLQDVRPVSGQVSGPLGAGMGFWRTSRIEGVEFFFFLMGGPLGGSSSWPRSDPPRGPGRPGSPEAAQHLEIFLGLRGYSSQGST